MCYISTTGSPQRISTLLFHGSHEPLPMNQSSTQASSVGKVLYDLKGKMEKRVGRLGLFSSNYMK